MLVVAILSVVTMFRRRIPPVILKRMVLLGVTNDEAVAHAKKNSGKFWPLLEPL